MPPDPLTPRAFGARDLPRLVLKPGYGTACAVLLFSTMSVSMQRYGKMRIEILMPLNEQSKLNSLFTNVYAVIHVINVHI